MICVYIYMMYNKNIQGTIEHIYNEVCKWGIYGETCNNVTLIDAIGVSNGATMGIKWYVDISCIYIQNTNIEEHDRKMASIDRTPTNCNISNVDMQKKNIATLIMGFACDSKWD